MLSQAKERERYSRHLQLAEIGIEGQEKLLASKVLIVGLGGLGCAAATYLAGSGVGHLTLLDNDLVELSNLNRQPLHKTDSINQFKVDSAANSLQELNPSIQLTKVKLWANKDWFMQQLNEFDLVLDCTDNGFTRYDLNSAALQHKIPWVSAAALGFEGQLTVFDPRLATSPCYRCLYPEINNPFANSCEKKGVFSPLVGVLGSLQAAEAVKLLLGKKSDLVGQLLTYNALASRFHYWKLPKSCC